MAEPRFISPAEQIANVISAMQATARAKPYNGQLADLRTMADQLAHMWASYQRGELPAVTDEIPF